MSHNDRNPTPDEPLWDALETARYLNISRASVYNLANSGKIPVVRIGALLRFQPREVRAFGKGGR